MRDLKREKKKIANKLLEIGLLLEGHEKDNADVGRLLKELDKVLIELDGFLDRIKVE